MVHTHDDESYLTVVALAAPFVLYCLGAIAGRLAALGMISCRKAWKLASLSTTCALFFSFGAFAEAAFHGATLTHKPRITTLASIGPVHLSVRFDLVESLMLLLVSLLGWVIVHYSRAYMAGDAREPYYASRLLQTLAAVSLLAVTNSLLLFLGAWVLTSLSLHGLLTLYPHRQAAVIAAHKKFLASRLGDLSLLGAVLLLGIKTGSFEIDKIMTYFAGPQPLSRSVHLAALLLAISAAIKCAQLPMHGWLIQVMEAPTPVSALLHAGVVNLGGFMLIRLAPVVNSSAAAEWFLVTVGCMTAIIASLVMTTRISIKVHLAWSTCAQMGFMLLECGLGLYGVAFLHLLAHSIYKAHAFLASGDTVEQAKVKRTSPPRPQLKPFMVIVGGLCGILMAGVGALLWQGSGRLRPDEVLYITIVGLAIASALTSVMTIRAPGSLLRLAALGFGVSVLYFGCERLFQRIVPASAAISTQPRALLMLPAGCFVLLFVLQAMVLLRPLGRLATSLYPWFYAGLHLDELFTRATFRLWPARHLENVESRRDANYCFESQGANL